MPSFSNPVVVLLSFLVSFATNSTAITSPPYMVLQPPHDLLYTSVLYRENRPVTLDCEAKGHPTPQYWWTKNGQRLYTDGGDMRLLQKPGKGTLIIDRPLDIDEGLYQCYADNIYGISLSQPVHLRRITLAVFNDTSEDFEVREGHPLSMKCLPPFGTPTPNVYWVLLFANWSTASVNGSRTFLDPQGGLHFFSVTRQDASEDRSYVCMAHSPSLKEYRQGKPRKLVVLPLESGAPNEVPPVRQYTSPKKLTGLRGQSIEIYCIYGGTPRPEIRWHRKHAPLPPGRHFFRDFGKVLRIEHLDFLDRGTYECVATNGVGQIGTEDFRVTIESVPFWTVKPESAVKREGETHVFSCMAGGVPEPKIQWYFNGVPVVEEFGLVSDPIVNGNNITLYPSPEVHRYGELSVQR